MRHTIRWTTEKITQRLALIEPLVYRRRSPLPPFRYRELPDPATPPPIHDNGMDWPTIAPNSYWGKLSTDLFRGAFTVPKYGRATTKLDAETTSSA
jgi:alpha-mannosidase